LGVVLVRALSRRLSFVALVICEIASDGEGVFATANCSQVAELLIARPSISRALFVAFASPQRLSIVALVIMVLVVL
jgi:hypothetical protein